MTKIQFILALRDKISRLPSSDIEERLGFYSEMIEDRMEEGLLEEEAVAAIGDIDAIAEQILSEAAPKEQSKIVTENKSTADDIQKKHLSPLAIALIILGFPLWFSLLAAAFSAVLALYIALWAVIISLWAILGSLIGCAIGGTVAVIVLFASGHSLTGAALLGCAAVSAGLAILFFYLCKYATKGAAYLTKLPFTKRRKK